jgi:pSer/pThr/pTyr-binding forkhead associated (FHA) protein
VADPAAGARAPADSTRALACALLSGSGIAGPSLTAVEGPATEERLAIHDGARLGRGRAAELRLADATVSRVHARFVTAGSATWVHDAGSKNGLCVNGRRLRRRGVALRAGDRLSLGESVLVYDLGAAPAGAGASPARLTAEPATPDPPPQARRRRRAGAARASAAAFLAAAILLAIAATASP